MQPEALWQTLRGEAQAIAASEPVLASYIHSVVLHHNSLSEVMSFHLARLLDSVAAPALLLREVCAEAFQKEANIIQQVSRDIVACYERDPACDHYLMPLLYFKGFHALQSYRIAHWLWQQERQMLALHFQSRMSEVFAVDIHPAAVIGSGILMDHATGVVIGETAVIEDDVSMLHEVTLGGSGRARGCRRARCVRASRVGHGRGCQNSGSRRDWRRCQNRWWQRGADGCSSAQHSGRCAGKNYWQASGGATSVGYGSKIK